MNATRCVVICASLLENKGLDGAGLPALHAVDACCKSLLLVFDLSTTGQFHQAGYCVLRTKALILIFCEPLEAWTPRNVCCMATDAASHL